MKESKSFLVPALRGEGIDSSSASVKMRTWNLPPSIFFAVLVVDKNSSRLKVVFHCTAIVCSNVAIMRRVLFL
jgi:hypothetical protein